MNLFITLLENVNKSRTSASNVSLKMLKARTETEKCLKYTGAGDILNF
jgi:hypothetical protein